MAVVDMWWIAVSGSKQSKTMDGDDIDCNIGDGMPGVWSVWLEWSNLHRCCSTMTTGRRIYSKPGPSLDLSSPFPPLPTSSVKAAECQCSRGGPSASARGAAGRTPPPASGLQTRAARCARTPCGSRTPGSQVQLAGIL